VASVLIDRSAEAVWKFMMTFTNYPKFDPAVLEVKQTSTGPLGVGTTFLLRQQRNPKITDARVIEYEPNRKFAFDCTSGMLKGSLVTVSFETIDGKTKLTETDDYKINGFYRLLVPFMRGQAKGYAQGRMGNVKRILESEAKS
jgi:hypothetical protein